jgi:hypothetical protein
LKGNRRLQPTLVVVAASQRFGYCALQSFRGNRRRLRARRGVINSELSIYVSEAAGLNGHWAGA